MACGVLCRLQYLDFKELCKKAFLIVRKQADLFINLLNMMLSTGQFATAAVMRYANHARNLCYHFGWQVTPNWCVFRDCLFPPTLQGIPELRTHDDVAYLQNTLFLDQTEEEAGESFKAEIDQALKDSWSVRVNWMAHIAAH